MQLVLAGVEARKEETVGGIPTEMRITLQVEVLPREQIHSWDEGTCLQCH